MEALARKSNLSVRQSLSNQTFQFDFHQAIEIIQQMSPGTTPLGEGSEPSKEAVAIKARVSLSPASAKIHSFTPPSAKNPQPILWINFMSIAGGPLPTPYTELLLERVRHHDTAFRDYLDIFNHRLASIWHRLKKQTFISYSQKDPTTTQVGKCLLSLCGFGNQALRSKVHVSDRSILAYHDLLWRRPRSAHGLNRILSTHFRLPVTVHQYQGAWDRAPEQDITKIGSKLGQMNRLGKETILGDKLWNQSAGIRIDVGPMTWKQLTQMLPVQIKDREGKVIAGSEYSALKDLTLLYAGLDNRITFRLKIYSFNVKPLRLNRQFSLGHNSWLTVGKPLKTPCFTDIVLT